MQSSVHQSTIGTFCLPLMLSSPFLSSVCHNTIHIPIFRVLCSRVWFSAFVWRRNQRETIYCVHKRNRALGGAFCRARSKCRMLDGKWRALSTTAKWSIKKSDPLLQVLCQFNLRRVLSVTYCSRCATLTQWYTAVRRSYNNLTSFSRSNLFPIGWHVSWVPLTNGLHNCVTTILPNNKAVAHTNTRLILAWWTWSMYIHGISITNCSMFL